MEEGECSGFCLKEDKAAINISVENQRYKRERTVANPLLFVVTQEDISEGRSKGGTHGHSVGLSIKVSVRKQNDVFSRKFRRVENWDLSRPKIELDRI